MIRCCSTFRRVASIRHLTTKSEQLQRALASRPTIYALATPPGKAGVAVVRVSGPHVFDVWKTIVRRNGKGKGKDIMEHARLIRCELLDANDGEVLDDGMAVFFQAPASYTTEDTIELHVHSSLAVLSRLMSSLSALPGVRQAERGEFTRRAFEAGRIDLTQAEALRDLIESETEVQRKWARKGVEGRAKVRYEAMRNDAILALATVEALIDFGEGEDIEEGAWDQARRRVSKLRANIAHHLSPSQRGEIYTSGLSLVIFGPPNAGKSSLLNHLAQREAAIVTPIPGTTRDVLEVALDIAGWRVKVHDTAGLRPSSDVVESIGVQRAGQAVEGADLAVCVLSLPELVNNGFRVPDMIGKHVTQETVALLNKVDAVDPAQLGEWLDFARMALPPGTPIWPISIQRGDGMSELSDGLAEVIKHRFHSEGDEPLITHARHRAHLEATLRFLDAFLALGVEDVVLAAEELRYAAKELSKVTGLIDVEDVLNAVFKEFCIGK
ncbi:P-loop containing nucleoside triphosphate hydrolase protein [Dacryopinax primogenitus]|uniref:p-loop containing nucleoside triphosphate hydrolase protein n=1 Tax=Dacryopinax primogenitus (strain DJM 731) TaxID=1858805 RepID=M5GFQ6_DACPD|nr:P-loop containing nucleoside triphosphate hydrolase protein [Dacryopinax primogenitus]EJU06512.1 P-loop containing nucleoside triphosphate hydrolase protein [Dacryopinax primogenitus]